MLFSEIYGSYFNVIAAVLAEASEGCLTERRISELVQEKAFAESALSIPAALKQEAWPLRVCPKFCVNTEMRCK